MIIDKDNNLVYINRNEVDDYSEQDSIKGMGNQHSQLNNSFENNESNSFENEKSKLVDETRNYNFKHQELVQNDDQHS